MVYDADGIYYALGGRPDIPILKNTFKQSSDELDKVELYANSFIENGTALSDKYASNLRPGMTFINKMICAGYNTGSGNYVDLFIPVPVAPGVSVTSVTASTSGSTIYTSSGPISLQNATAEVLSYNTYGIVAEFRYSSTQMKSIPVSGLLINVKVTCT
jgi:hypothetical protein